MIVMDILESYNTKIDLDWQQKGHSLIAYFDIEDEHYDIQINQLGINIPGRTEWNVYEISFRRILGDISTVSQTSSKVASKVFGIIYNGVLEVILTDKPECIIFSAKFTNDKGDVNMFNKRVQLYQTIVNRIVNFGIYADIGSIKSQYAHNFVLVRNDLKITSDEVNWIKVNC